MGYKLESDKKQYVTTIRLTEREYKTMKRIAMKLKVSHADFIRHAIRQEGERAVKELF